MARLAGSGKEYQLAKRTIENIFKGMDLINDNYPAAIQKMIDIMNNPKSPLALVMGASKFIIENQHKIAKEYGKNPKPADFVVDKEVKIIESGDDNLIEMEFIG